ncbi:hypothetical protein EVAR_68391_1 [Eumeta japonica]|uniref:Uncharacterized protein n=1 Tax=Eumeta variegata TaxID=151549 RepID=A0A4C2ACY3_EUMVA|nr:hypothetical protein EVAR_68391_1 [Eumeta japonica]
MSGERAALARSVAPAQALVPRSHLVAPMRLAHRQIPPKRRAVWPHIRGNSRISLRHNILRARWTPSGGERHNRKQRLYKLTADKLSNESPLTSCLGRHLTPPLSHVTPPAGARVRTSAD